MQINRISKSKIKGYLKFIASIKYDILFAIEVVALFFATIHCIFDRKKEFSFLVAISTLAGSLITLSGIKHLNSKLKSKKYVDIISTEKSAVVSEDND